MIADSDLGALRAAVRGPVLTQHDPEFGEDASGYNAAVVHQPEVIVAATSAADVAATIGWAAEHSLPVAVQATGHGVTERMVDGVLISTRQMQDVQIQPDRRLARVAAGVKWKTLLSQTLPHGLVGLCGSSSDVGIVGFTLGGGLPLLGRALGFAADRVRSIEVVTPDASIRTVDAEHEADLFEVLRGGKGNFGVVTALEFELIELSDFYGGGLMFPGTDAEVVMTAFRGWLADLPDEACPSIALLRLPDVPFVPEPLRGQFVVHVRFAFAGSKEEGDRLLAPMRAVSQVIMDTAGPMSYEQIDLVNLDPPEPIPYQEAAPCWRTSMTPRKPRCSRWLVRARKRHCCWWSSDPWVALSPARPRAGTPSPVGTPDGRCWASGCLRRRSPNSCRPASRPCSTRCAPGRPASRWSTSTAVPAMPPTAPAPGRPKSTRPSSRRSGATTRTT